MSIKASTSNDVKKKVIHYPKLMIGLRTGTIYLALSEFSNIAGITQVTTVVLKPEGTSQAVGDVYSYEKELLEDFNETLTLRNE